MAGNDFSYERVGALDIAEAISKRIGSYVDMNFIQFLAVERERVFCWYMNSGGKGPSYEITLILVGNRWNLELVEHPAGTTQGIEIP